MSMVLLMSALGALALTSGIALIAVQPGTTGDEGRYFQRHPNMDGISVAGREHAHAAMRGHFERA